MQLYVAKAEAGPFLVLSIGQPLERLCPCLHSWHEAKQEARGQTYCLPERECA
jgi:hypothetical protein